MTYIVATILLEAKQALNETLITSNWSCALKAAFSSSICFWCGLLVHSLGIIKKRSGFV